MMRKAKGHMLYLVALLLVAAYGVFLSIARGDRLFLLVVALDVAAMFPAMTQLWRETKRKRQHKHL